MAIEYAPLFALETQFQTKDGRNNTGGWLKVFLAATDDQATTYSDYNGTRNPEKIVLDDDGRAVVICDKSKAYRLEVYGIDGTLLWTEEPVYCSGTGGGGVSITKVISTDGSISVDENVAGSTTTYDLSLGIDADDLKPSCLKASATPVTSDGQFVFAETAREGTLLSVDNGGKVRMEPAWYHFTATVELAYDGTPVNEGRRVTLWATGSSSVIDFDTSYAHRESIELSGDIHVDSANTEFPLGVTGIGDGIRAYLVGFDIHAVTGHGGNNEYRAGEGITIDSSTRTISADFDSVQEKLVAGDNISITGNVISAGNISQEQADWTEDDTSSPAYIKNKPDLGVYATRTEVNACLAGKQDVISDLAQIRAGAASGASAVQPSDLAAVATTGDYDDLDNRPDLGVYATRTEVNTGLAGKQDTIPDLAAIRSGAQLGATSVQPADLGSYATDAELAAGLATKQDVIDDLSEIRSGAAAGVTAVQPADLATVATSGDYDDLVNKPSIPDKTSDLTNDSGFITSADVPVKGVEVDGASVVNAQGVAEITMPDLSGYATTQALDTGLAGKQDVISDLSAIRSGAAAGATAVQPGDLATVATTGSYDDLSGKPDLSVYATGAELTAGLAAKQDTIPDLATIRSGAAAGATAVQPDDLATVATSGAYEDLSDKPDLSVYATGSELTAGLATKQDTISDLATIRSGAAAGATAVQPGDLATVATTGDYDDLTGKPTIPSVDQTYDAASANAQSGTAVAGALATVSQVPAVTSGDNNKTLVSTYNDGVGSYAWVQNTFIATYGTTTYAEVKAAIDAGYNVLCLKTDSRYGKSSFAGGIGYIYGYGIHGGNIEFNYFQPFPNNHEATVSNQGIAIVHIWKLNFNNTWTESTVVVAPKIVASSPLSLSYSNVNRQVTLGISLGSTLTTTNNAIEVATPLPASTSSDEGKVLTVNDQGSPEWTTAQAPISAGNGIDITNDVVSVDTSVVATQTDLATKQDTISDLATIRSGAQLGATAVQPGDLPSVDQSYSSSSANAQSGTAVAQAISGVDAVPKVTSSDSGKVLVAAYSGGTGSYAWASAPPANAVILDSGSTWSDFHTAYSAGRKDIYYKYTIRYGSPLTSAELYLHLTAVSDVDGSTGNTFALFEGAWQANTVKCKFSYSGSPLVSFTSLTVDQSYSSSSTRAQSGAAVAQAISAVNQVPASTSADEGKILTVDSNGDPEWGAVLDFYATTQDLTTGLAGKQDTISDLATIRSGAAAGATAVQDPDYVHTDENFTSAEKTKLAGIEAGAQVNVNADWNAASGTDAYIANKPQNLVQDANYVHTDENFTSSDKSKLAGIEAGAEVNVKPDWNAVAGADDEILNKPTIPSGTQLVPAATSADADKVLTVNAQGTPAWASAQAPISAGNGIDITNNVVSAKVDGTTVTINASGELEAAPAVTVDQTYNATSTNPQSGTAVAQAIATKEDVFDVGTGLEMDTSGATPTLQVEAPVDIVAGPGIVIDNPDGNTLRVSMAQAEEVVLWSGTKYWWSDTSDLQLSEAASNFEAIRVKAKDDWDLSHTFTFFPGDNSVFDVSLIGYEGGSLTIKTSKFSVSGTTVSLSEKIAFNVGSDNKVTTNTTVSFVQFSEVVGIHRIAGGN